MAKHRKISKYYDQDCSLGIKEEGGGGVTTPQSYRAPKKSNRNKFNHNRTIKTKERQKILSLLNEASDSRFLIRKWNIVNDQSNGIYDVGNEIIHNTELLKSNLCDQQDAYILVRSDITI